MKTYIVTMNDGKTFTVKAPSSYRASEIAFARSKENIRKKRFVVQVKGKP